MRLSFRCLKSLFGRKKSFVILDDFFPNLLTGFRVAEYNWYLECFPKLRIYSTYHDFVPAHAAYAIRYPQYADRVLPYDKSALKGCAFAYLNFLNNARLFLADLTENEVPFAFTLYPGGGFGLEEPESDAKLNVVLDSKFLKGIIATQSVTLDYLQNRDCRVPVHDLYGGAINQTYFDTSVKRDYTLTATSGREKICFVAERYMSQGANKGYPEFIEATNLLVEKFPDVEISVVGSFGPEDYPLGRTLERVISFNGLLKTEELKDYLFTQDIIVSPNRPFMLHPGNFDGFPTGCCVEASLCGVAVVCTDVLGLNRYYSDGEDIVICQPSSQDIFQRLTRLIENPQLRLSIAQNGQQTSAKIFDPAKQLGARSELLKGYAATFGADLGRK